jgi:PKD domain
VTATPATGSAPLSVTADASASTDPQSEALSFTFDFGDGTIVGPQASAIATHVYAAAGNYTLAVTATNTSHLTATAQTSVSANVAVLTGVYTPDGPARILDTRSKIGVSTSTPVAANGTVVLQVAGVHGVPATGVTAVVMNVTATGPTTTGYVTVYPHGQARPTASNINFVAGKTIAGLVIVPVVDGKVSLYNGSAGTVHMIADLAGYYGSGTGATYTPDGPVRSLDTRSKVGVSTSTPVAANGTVVLQVAGVHGVPATGVTAVVMNVTATGPTTTGYVTVYPHGQARPTASNINFVAGTTIANLVVVPVVDGKVSFYNGSAGTVHMIADLAGYFTG